MDRALLGRFPELRIVARYTIGVDDVDVNAATALGVLVMHSPTEANWGGVAEGAVAMMLALLKKLRLRDSYVRRGGWRADALQGTYVGAREDGYAGITFGIIGLGRAGRRVAELLAPWRARLIATDPYVDAEVFSRLGTSAVDLATLLGEADVVTIHCNLTDETRSMIDSKAIASMKPTALLVNPARGPIVDLDALCDALETGRIAGAALDVFPEEPLPASARIRALDDGVMLSPHMVAANAGGTLRPAIPWVTEATLDALRGRVPGHVYNVEAIDKWQARFGGRSTL
jgi:phosphoglycerate dehydrogenase-like enzyme